MAGVVAGEHAQARVVLGQDRIDLFADEARAVAGGEQHFDVRDAI